MCANELSGFCEWNGPPEKPPPDGQPDDDRHRRAGAVVLLRGDGDEVVPGAGDEVGELHLGDRAHAHDRRAGAAADDRRLRERRVDARATAPNSSWKPERDLEGAAVDADVLADQEDALVAPHLLPRRPSRDRLEVGLLGHRVLLVVGRVELFGRRRRRRRVTVAGSGSGDSSARSDRLVEEALDLAP